ncbi:flagella basal body P-ring formation protein FlgA [Litorimonas taeanensis]|uniref:Flagella basal body P-ring formation protein FlgA n=1 Tax=Litorimonas taeanensis TaxID=568099 RepID=A0A420WMN8_9PROT|nr:flagellar basal body P-ring formation chaperone FlgA [Litorimonas taeanensis]RKQ72155.1 flagella basal body P-ring formation protein FlgA [Litorimonas taeanensis]
MKLFKVIVALGATGLMLPDFAIADEVIANSTLRRGTQITAADLNIDTDSESERVALLSQYVGMSVVRTISSGAEINPKDVAEPVQVKRNSTVKMIYRLGRLEITATGRALGEGRMGDIITVMNSESRKRVEGRVTGLGVVEMIR